MIKNAATGPPIKEPMTFPKVPAATPTLVALAAPHSSKMGPKAEAVPTPPDMEAEEHCRARSGFIPIKEARPTPRRFWQVIKRQAATAIITQSFPPACLSIFALKPKPTHRKKIFCVRSFISVASKVMFAIPVALMIEIMMEKMIPDTTGAGIAYFLKAAE